jgi:hypothetical protein
VEFSIPTAGANPDTIAIDRSGNVWFIESGTSQLAEIPVNEPGVVVEYPVVGLTPGTPPSKPSPTPTPTPTPTPKPTGTSKPTPTPTPTSTTGTTPPPASPPRSGNPSGLSYLTRTVLVEQPKLGNFGQPIRLTATVKGLGRGARTPTGSITFREGTLILGTVVLRHGKASFKTSSLPVGANLIEADYVPGLGFYASAATGVENIRVSSSRSKSVR